MSHYLYVTNILINYREKSIFSMDLPLCDYYATNNKKIISGNQ